MLAYASGRVINLFSALIPTLEGLLLVTVLDGREGRILIRYHDSQTAEVELLIKNICQNYPAEFRLADAQPKI